MRDTSRGCPFADIGLHRIRLCLGRVHLDMPREEHPAAVADHAFVPVLAYHGPEVTPPLAGISGLSSLVPGWLTRGKDGKPVLRLHETCGRRGRATVAGASAVVDFLDRPMEKHFSQDGSFDVRPYEIISLKID